MGTQLFGGFIIFFLRVTGEKQKHFQGFVWGVCTMVYFKDFSKHQKAPFKGLARKSLIFIFILFYLLEP